MAFETPLYPPKTSLTPLSNPTRTLCQTLCKTSESQGSPKTPYRLLALILKYLIFLKERILGLEQHKSGNSGPGPDQCNFPR